MSVSARLGGCIHLGSGSIDTGSGWNLPMSVVIRSTSCEGGGWLGIGSGVCVGTRVCEAVAVGVTVGVEVAVGDGVGVGVRVGRRVGVLVGFLGHGTGRPSGS